MAFSIMTVIKSVSQAPIDTLPPELVIVIFQVHTSQDPLAPLALRGICRRWRGIADAVPSLWQRIYLDSATTAIRNLHRLAALYLNKSRPLPVDVEVWAHDPDCLLPILSPLLPSISRWRSFSTTGFRTETLDMTAFPMSATASFPIKLDRLVLNLHDYDFDELDDGDPGEDTPFAVSHPTFWSSGLMQLWVTSLPSTDQIIPLHFTHLTINEGALEAAQTCPSSILGVLSACPSLRVFLFEGWQHEEETGAYPHSNTVVTLPHLETLKIRTTYMTRPLLSSLSTPRLLHLSLCYLNVEHQFLCADQFGDEGESEDEAKDYSQSPWSDRATGLGLRSLISRCHPRLRSLEMDYSDLRTKDFKWVFERLDSLEEFRIMASDMSDKVIRLLKPEPGLGRDGKPKLLLPRLRKLELLYCQRLTGQAIAAALIPRAIFTDSTSDTHLYHKFKHVCITGCDGLDPHHELLLRSTLGPRFAP